MDIENKQKAAPVANAVTHLETTDKWMKKRRTFSHENH